MNEEALPLLVKHLDKDNDGKISFEDFMDGIKGWLNSVSNDDEERSDTDGNEEVFVIHLLPIFLHISISRCSYVCFIITKPKGESTI